MNRFLQAIHFFLQEVIYFLAVEHFFFQQGRGDGVQGIDVSKEKALRLLKAADTIAFSSASISFAVFSLKSLWRCISLPRKTGSSFLP